MSSGNVSDCEFRPQIRSLNVFSGRVSFRGMEDPASRRLLYEGSCVNEKESEVLCVRERIRTGWNWSDPADRDRSVRQRIRSSAGPEITRAGCFDV